MRPLVAVISCFANCVSPLRIPEKIRNIDLVVYEKNEGVGGVWYVITYRAWIDSDKVTIRWLNKYPGLACDIPCKLGVPDKPETPKAD